MVFKNALNCKKEEKRSNTTSSIHVSEISTNLYPLLGFVKINTYPSSIGIDKTMAITTPIFVKKLRNRYPKEEGEPRNDKISHGVHVCELKKWQPNWCCILMMKYCEVYKNIIAEREVWLKVNSIPTRPKRTQYNAAKIGNGIEAKTAPNLPAEK